MSGEIPMNVSQFHPKVEQRCQFDFGYIVFPLRPIEKSIFILSDRCDGNGFDRYKNRKTHIPCDERDSRFSFSISDIFKCQAMQCFPIQDIVDNHKSSIGVCVLTILFIQNQWSIIQLTYFLALSVPLCFENLF
jgi:hypothetical protein